MTIRSYDFISGVEGEASSELNVSFESVNTSSTPLAIVAGDGIPLTSNALKQVIYVVGSGGEVNITANPQIAVPTYEGTEIILYGTSDTNTVTLENGTGLVLDASVILKNGTLCRLIYTSGAWRASGGANLGLAIEVDTISEKTSGSGVTIDGVLLKDSIVSANTISEKTSGSGVTVDGLLIKDGAIPSISIPTSGTYTPTASGNVGMVLPTMHTCFYTKIGNIVTVYCSCSCATTNNSYHSTFDMTIPVAKTSNFTANSATGHGIGTNYNQSTARCVIEPDTSQKTTVGVYIQPAFNISYAAITLKFNFTYTTD